MTTIKEPVPAQPCVLLGLKSASSRLSERQGGRIWGELGSLMVVKAIHLSWKKDEATQTLPNAQVAFGLSQLREADLEPSKRTSYLPASWHPHWRKAQLSTGGGTVRPIIETSPPRLTVSQNMLLLGTALMCTGFHVRFGCTIPLVDLARREEKDWSPHLKDQEEFWDQAARILTRHRAFLLPVTIEELKSQLSFLIWGVESVSVPSSVLHRPFTSERPFIGAENLLLICWSAGVIPSYTEPPSSGKPFKLRELLTRALKDAGIEFAEIVKILNSSPLFAKDRLSIRRAEASLDILEEVLRPMAPDFPVSTLSHGASHGHQAD